jgi:predicted GIY-YIG superfamily endonuclease
MPAWFYILRLCSGNYYCGSTKDREQRYNAHFTGRGCRTTRVDSPIEVLHEEKFNTYRETFHREHQVKRWTRAKKEALIDGRMYLLKKLAKRRRK